MSYLHAKLAHQIAVAIGMRTCVALALGMLIIIPGCGPADVDFDNAVHYTPESLAAEMALRYKALGSDAKASASKFKPKTDRGRAEQLARVQQADKKKGAGGPGTKKESGPPTLEDLLGDIDGKLGLIRGMTRTEAGRKMTETISNDGTLTESDKKTLSELVTKLVEGV
jgi:hypothetical protein